MTQFANWRKSSRSTQMQGQCVEIGFAPGRIGIRDTKLGESSPILDVDGAAFAAFVRRVQDDAFDI
ncbi:DUF397 domain-containing protein [Saccharopolyspora shandongensis]|uniref:DUF397 domain-containing protein n=1 Tax=Saccharopolyspora shandongensis TaxID=418495 RepID=UPI0033EF5D94